MKRRRRTIGRIITRASVFLLLGAIVNVAVAWGIAFWYRPLTGQLWYGNEGQWVYVKRPYHSYSGRYYGIYLFRSAGMLRIWCLHHGLVNEVEFCKDVRNRIDNGGLVRQLDLPRWTSACDVARTKQVDSLKAREDAFGWPVLTLRCDYEEDVQLNKPHLEACMIRGGIALPDYTIPGGIPVANEKLAQGLPARPIWPGFAINTILYGAILWLLFAAPFALRRRRRIKRGLCPACAYPIGPSPVCTECGKPTMR